MNVKTAKIIRICLLVVACITFLVGLSLSSLAEQEAATDLSRIKVEVTEKDCYFNEKEDVYSNGCYHINLTYKITNKTKVVWKYIEIKTYVYDKSGKQLATLTSKFGSGYTDFKLKAGETINQKSDFEENSPDDSFMTIYEKDLSELKFESEVSYGTYENK